MVTLPLEVEHYAMVRILYVRHQTEANEANLADSTQSKTLFSPLTVHNLGTFGAMISDMVWEENLSKFYKLTNTVAI